VTRTTCNKAVDIRLRPRCALPSSLTIFRPICACLAYEWPGQPPKAPFSLGFRHPTGGGPSHGSRQHAQINWQKIVRVVPEMSSRTYIQTSRLVFTARLRPQFRTPPVRNAPSFDRCTPPRRRFNQNIPSSVVLLQQCNCRNYYSGKLQNISHPSVLFESGPIFFTIHTGGTGAKTMDRIVKFEFCDF